MEKLSFYNVRTKKKVMMTNYKIVTRKVNGKPRRFAVAKDPKSGMAMWRVLPNK